MAEKKLTNEELRSQVAALARDSILYVDTELSPQRAKATKYYKREAFGNEEEGRSQVVLSEVADAIQGVIPQMMRVIFGAEHPVEFTPNGPEDEAIAAQATDYVRHIFMEENNGFLRTLDVIKDGLIRRLGIYKWAWEDDYNVTQHRLENVDEEQLMILAMDDEVELTRIDGPRDNELEDGSVATVFDVEFTRTTGDGCVKVYSIPPEEFLYHRDARDIETALYIAHRTYKTASELREMGIKEEDIEEWGNYDSSLEENDERLARKDDWAEDGERPDEAHDKILYIESYAMIDFDGDKKTERRKICTIGTGFFPVVNEPHPEPPPFSIFVPDPEPHTMTGLSWADRTMDIQLTKSSLLRGALDSLALSIFPRTAYVEGQVEVEDIMSTAIGQPIRMRQIGAVQELSHDFKGREAIPLIQMMDEIKESRTGINKGAAGLDADALQSSTKAAVGAAVTASQAQAEMLVRVFCEMALKPLFRGLYSLLVKHQPRAKVVRLRNQWVNVDPRQWNERMDVTVNVALGTGLVEEKLATLEGIAETQGAILQQYGPSNPLVTLAQYRHTLASMVELRGFKDTSKFFNEVDPNWQPPQQDPNAEAQQSPEMILAQVEQQRIQSEIQMKQAELALKEREIALRDDRERDKIAAEIELKRLEIMLKHNADIERAQMMADVAQTRATTMAGPQQEAPQGGGQ